MLNSLSLFSRNSQIMLLRNSFSHTKKFFRKTLENVKSIFSGGQYQKLPKSPPYNPYMCTNLGANMINVHTTYKDMEKMYVDFAEQWGPATNKDQKNTAKKTTVRSPSPNKKNAVTRLPAKKREVEIREGKREERSCLVVEKLKELEMMDLSNVDHVLDIEEIIHYYSRLTCPAYLDIVDKFFMEMYAEILGPPTAPPSVTSRPKLRPLLP